MKVPACVALLAAGVTLSAQSQSNSAQAPPRPTFKTGVNAVVVDARVVDRNGRFISDLAVDDFQVFEDGREQPITTFELVDLPPPPSSPALLSAIDSGPPPDVATNTGFDDGRLYVIVLDDIYGSASQVVPGAWPSPYTPRSLPALELARELILHMADGDRAAVVTTTGRRDMAQEFTNDRARLLATVDRYVENQGQDPECPVESRGCGGTIFGPNPFLGVRATIHDAMLTLKDVANWLGAIEGRRKALVLVSQRLVGVSANLAITNWSRKAGLQNLEAPADMRALIEATSRANVTIYTLSPTIQPTRDAVMPVADEYVEAMRETQRTSSIVSIAQATGGFSRAFDYNGVFERIASESGSYYLIGFISSLTKEDGKFHRVEVRTRRPELGVRSRAGYVSKPKPTLRDSMIPNNTPMALAEALQSPASMTGLPLRVSAVPYRGTDLRSFVSVVVDLEDAKTDSNYEIAIAAAPINGKAADVRRVTVNGGTVTSRLDLKPGRYHLRTAALETTGDRRGSVLLDLDVPDFSSGPLTMSGVVLGSQRTARPNAIGRDQAWKDHLGIPPTTRREFDQDDELRSYVEVYDNTRGRASEIEVLTTVRSEDGQVQFTSRETSTVDASRGALPPHPVRTTILLQDIEPGASVLTIEARRVDGTGEPAIRRVPFTVK